MAAFMKLGDIKGEFQADELTGTFNALNETTNVRPSKGESISIVHPAFKTGYDTGPIGSPVELNSLDVGPVNKTADKGWWTVDGADFRDSELDALNETTNFDDKGYSPISGEGVFKPQDIDAKGSVIWGDNHFTPDRGGDSLMGMRNPGGPIGSKIWGWNSVASTFEDRVLDGGFDANDFHATPWNDVEFGMRQNVGSTAGPGGSSYMTETFEPAAGMNSFGESLNPVLELGTNSGPGGTTFMTGQFDMPTDNIGSTSGPGGSTF